MWPINDPWANVLIIVAAAAAAVMAIGVARIVARSTKPSRGAVTGSLAVGLLVVLFLVIAMQRPWTLGGEECVYAPTHPSDC